MKRTWIVLLVLAMCISCCALAEEMQLQIVNCQEWVSLRSAADVKSDRLAQVPLGAYVTGEYDPSAEFSRCRYGALDGYILNAYLSPAENQDGVLHAPEGRVILEYADAQLRVQAVRSITSAGESLWIGCTDADGAALWSHAVGPLDMTELDRTYAFVNTAAEAPFVAVYDAETGLAALDLQTGAPRWTLDNQATNLGGGLCHAIGEDGTMYIGGYYGPDPVAVSADGALLWAASSRYGESDGYPLEFWWLYHLEMGDGGLIATYDSGSESGGRVLFSLDGRMLAYSFMDE